MKLINLELILRVFPIIEKEYSLAKISILLVLFREYNQF